jgi:hypothetical protein
MTPLVLKLASPRRGAPGAPTHPIRAAIALLWGRDALDHVREPEGLQYPVSERGRRLMRNARVCGG